MCLDYFTLTLHIVIWYTMGMSHLKIHSSTERTGPFCKIDRLVWQFWRNRVKILWYKSQSTFFSFFDLWFWYSHSLVCSWTIVVETLMFLCLHQGYNWNTPSLTTIHYIFLTVLLKGVRGFLIFFWQTNKTVSTVGIEQWELYMPALCKSVESIYVMLVKYCS